VIVEQDGGERLAHVPFQMIGEHAQEHVGAHAWADPMEDRTNVEVDGLEAAEGALDAGQALIGAHRISGIESIGWHIGAQHVEAVERGFCGDRGVIARDAQRVIRDDRGWLPGGRITFEVLADFLVFRRP